MTGKALQLYTDAGVIGRNPSKHGGTWAWCLVANGERIDQNSGTITPTEAGMEVITNNFTELLAAVIGLENLPAGVICCHWFTDSNVTLLRLTTSDKFNGIPGWLANRARAVRRRVLSAVLLGGHPNKKELVSGVRKDGFPVSVHNVWCDKTCSLLAKGFKKALAA